MWKCFLENNISEKEKSIVVLFIHNLCFSKLFIQLIESGTFDYFFTNLLFRFDPQEFDDKLWEILKQVVLELNKHFLQIHCSGKTWNVHSLQIIGLSQVWNVAMLCPKDSVHVSATQLIKDIYMGLTYEAYKEIGDSLNEKIVNICMSFLASSETPEISKIRAAKFMSFYIDHNGIKSCSASNS